MEKLRDYLELIRWKQILFKNSIIIVPFIFSIGKFAPGSFFRNLIFIILGFLALGLVSAFNYINNDINDCEKDKNHPEKKNRAIASGRISKGNAFAVSIVLLLASLSLSAILSYFSSWVFMMLVILIFINSWLYNSYFRNIVFLDIIMISINFVMRAMSGIFLIKGGEISYWMMLCTFFLSIFLVSSKRVAETKLKGIKDYRKSYEKVNENFMMVIIGISISSVLIFFSTYSILFNKPLLLLSLPVFIYALLLYFNSIYEEPEKIRNPEEFIFARRTIILMILWTLIVVLAFILS